MHKLINFICIVYIHVHIIIFFQNHSVIQIFYVILIIHNYHEKTRVLPTRKQRRRSDVQ